MRNNREHKTINIFWLKLWPSSEKTSHTWHTLGAHKTFAEWLTHNNQLCENASKFFRDILGSNPKASSFPSSCCNSLEWYLLQALLEYAFISHQCCLAPITGRVHEITHPVIICRFSLFLSFSSFFLAAPPSPFPAPDVTSLFGSFFSSQSVCSPPALT